ncbi:MAG: SAM-dependent methyltransferase [Prevotella ruminicola]|jgi:predicted O-methyltransferase YrrM|uniref:SAM-dependent methyltransferase n=1 Tax=Xylanibacter ruminicola TaxID=839 RepID=A0A928BTR8_XYLRU|nr:SAM-dependent methyltransferase [Xylanibacter ruminicola]
MNEATLEFIRIHADEDVRQLAFLGKKNPEVDMAYALDQIAGRQKARVKIPSWASIDGIVYPPHISMEQCSSEQTARYKARIAGNGEKIVDLTAGFGVDMAFMSAGFKQAVHVEMQPQLCAISSENYKCLGLNHIQVVCSDGVGYLHQMEHADLIFIDPARRDQHGARTYGIADCTPNVLEIIDEMLQKADRVMIKLSPMLDWQKTVADVGNVSQVHIVSVGNECKELLLEVKKGKDEKVKVFCVNDDQVFSYEIGEPHPFTLSPLHPFTLSPLHPFTFLYEPNASVMKAGCFQLIEQRFGVTQPDANSHLFLSEQQVDGFPGRGFVIERVSTMNKRELKEALAGIDKANVAVRNFPLSVADLRKRLKLKDGGDVYIFATTDAKKGHLVMVCRKIS